MAVDVDSGVSIDTLMPIGKYKGAPLAAVMADNDYRNWLIEQPWFRTKFSATYNVLMMGAPPEETPEHNEMQARFLEDAWCLSLAGLLKIHILEGVRAFQASCLYSYRDHVSVEASKPSARCEFEVNGWDVVLNVETSEVSAHLDSLDVLPECTCVNHCDTSTQHNSYCASESALGDRRRSGKHCDSSCQWHDSGAMGAEATGDAPERGWSYNAPRRARVGALLLQAHESKLDYWGSVRKVYCELKPDLGDDYPAVLRQMKGYPGKDGIRCLVVRRHQFEGVDLAQVRAIFAKSRVYLLEESQLLGAVDSVAAMLKDSFWTD